MPLLSEALGADWHGALQTRAVAGSNLAVAYLQLGRLQEADAAARRALDDAPHALDARSSLARAIDVAGWRTEDLLPLP